MIDPSFLTFPLDKLGDLRTRTPDLLEGDMRRTRALFNDEFPEYPLQVELLSSAAYSNVPAALAAAGQQGGLTIEAARLSHMLARRFGFQDYMARWAVAAWAHTLGLSDEEAVSSTLTAETVSDSGNGPAHPASIPSSALTVESRPPASGPPSEQRPRPDLPRVAHTGTDAPLQPQGTRNRLPGTALAGGAVAVVVLAAVVGVVLARAFGPAPPRTPTPTPTPAATPTPTAAATPTAAPFPTLSQAAIKRQDVGIIGANGYIANTKIPGFAFTSDGDGGTLYAWTATCRGSGDGYCQKVFFFDGAHLLGTDTKTNSTAINSVEAAGDRVVDVTYADYKSSDALCCPSGPPVTISYTWNGSSLTASGTPPGH